MNAQETLHELKEYIIKMKRTYTAFGKDTIGEVLVCEEMLKYIDEINRKSTLGDDKMNYNNEELKQLTTRISEMLRETGNPHQQIIITQDNVVMTEDVFGFPSKQEDN